MLPEILTEALRFFDRDYLDRLCLVSRRLTNFIEHGCAKYPLRDLRTVHFNVTVGRIFRNGVRLHTDIFATQGLTTRFSNVHPFLNLSEALSRLGAAVNHAFIHSFVFVFASYQGPLLISADHWSILSDSLRGAVVKSLKFDRIDFAALNVDSLFEAVSCTGLKEFDARKCPIPAAFVTDAFLRHCDSSGLLRLDIGPAKDGLFEFSEEALLDLYFPTSASSDDKKREFNLDGCKVSDMFVKRLFEVIFKRFCSSFR